MAELEFIKVDLKKERPVCCGPVPDALPSPDEVSHETCPPVHAEDLPSWITATITTSEGAIPVISTGLTGSDYWEHAKCRASAFRNDNIVNPGLYAAGVPDRNSAVVVSANYKLSFDVLRKALKGLDVWVLVLDTKGINVWCAAGKGTFGTDELIRRISMTRLAGLVEHRQLILPQLGAPGVSAHKVRQKTGFTVFYGPVRATDIPAYVRSGYKATRQMRTVTFPLADRLVLTPMEIRPALKYYLWFALVIPIVFGLQPSGIIFKDAFSGGMPFLLFGLLSVFTGAFLTPMLLPVVPSKSFAVKGWLAGILCLYPAAQFTTWTGSESLVLEACAYLFFPLASSYIALQFTGSTTFTGMSGVKKELKIAIPLYIIGTIVSMILLLIFKLGQWRLI